MHRQFRWFVLLAMLRLPGALSAAPGVVTINFDGLPDGQRIEEEYASSGVHFVNDYQPGLPFRSCPQITATAVAWSHPNVLVNECLEDRIYSSHNVPMVIRFDQAIAGVGMRLGRVGGSATSATISLFDAGGTLRAKRTLPLADDFTTGVEVWDPTQSARLVVIDYGNSSSPEALDDLAFMPGAGSAADTAPPAVLITAPPDNTMIAATPVTLRGTVSDNSGAIASFRVNGVDGVLTPRSGPGGKPTYEFIFDQPLSPGSNPITAMAWDGAGNKGSHSITLHYGAPTLITLPEFHLTQRGIMRQKKPDVDAPLVAAKFTIVRIAINARTAQFAPTYVSAVKLTLYRRDGMTDVKVSDFWGTAYSPYVSSFNSSSQMAGVHFWIAPMYVETPGEYALRFQCYLGNNPVGPVLQPQAAPPYFEFAETRPVNLLILPVEAPFFAPELGQEQHEQTLRVLSFLVRSYPMADNGLQYLVGAPLLMGDGSAAMDAAFDYIKGTGFEWTFKEAHPGGLWRAPVEVAFSGTTPIGGRVTTAPLANLPRPSKYGLFRPGCPPQWELWKGFVKKYPMPMDDNHNGTVDDDMPNYMAEFRDNAGAWSTTFADYQRGMTFRGFRDQNKNHNFDTGEPEAPAVRRWRHVVKELLDGGPAIAARNALSPVNPPGGKPMLASLWFHYQFHPESWQFDMIGGGQGSQDGEDSWVRPEPQATWLQNGEYPNGGAYTLAHEVGHNFDLHDKYFDGIPKSEYEISAWQAYVHFKAVGANGLLSVMYGGAFPNRLFFTDDEYLHLFNKLKVNAQSAARRPEGPTQPAFRISGLIGPNDSVSSVDSAITSATEFSEPDPASLYHVQLGTGNTVLSDFFFPLRQLSPMDFARAQKGLSWNPALNPYSRFDVLIPFPEDGAWAKILCGGRVLLQQTRSLHAPNVQVLYPNGGESFGPDANVRIRWSATDPDGGSLLCSILYSPDGGARWFTVASGITDRSYVWNTRSSPGGSAALIRVTACDGFDTGEDESDGVFSVFGKAPLATILQPTSGSVFLQWESIPLLGEAVDLEGQPMFFTWRVDGVERGTTRSLLLAPVAPGRHTAQLRVFDADGLSVSVASRFTVLADADRDGMADAFEEQHALDPGWAGDALLDPDGDGLNNFEEARYGTSPRNRDTDGDGWSDADEVRAGSDPRDPRNTPPQVTPARHWNAYR